jgi:hypothetical protein
MASMSIRMVRNRRLASLVVAGAAILALPLAADAHSSGPTAQAATKCNIDKVSRSLGPTYVTSLDVFHVSCNDGISLVKAFHKCRMAKGKKGTCKQKVQGYTCSETRSGIKTQFSGKVSCTKGKRTVKHTYTQFT